MKVWSPELAASTEVALLAWTLGTPQLSTRRLVVEDAALTALEHLAEQEDHCRAMIEYDIIGALYRLIVDCAVEEVDRAVRIFLAFATLWDAKALQEVMHDNSYDMPRMEALYSSFLDQLVAQLETSNDPSRLKAPTTNVSVPPYLSIAFLNKLAHLLGDSDNSHIQTAAIQVITCLCKITPRVLAPWLLRQHLLPPIYKRFIKLSEADGSHSMTTLLEVVDLVWKDYPESYPLSHNRVVNYPALDKFFIKVVDVLETSHNERLRMVNKLLPLASDRDVAATLDLIRRAAPGMMLAHQPGSRFGANTDLLRRGIPGISQWNHDLGSRFGDSTESYSASICGVLFPYLSDFLGGSRSVEVKYTSLQVLNVLFRTSFSEGFAQDLWQMIINANGLIPGLLEQLSTHPYTDARNIARYCIYRVLQIETSAFGESFLESLIDEGCLKIVLSDMIKSGSVSHNGPIVDSGERVSPIQLYTLVCEKVFTTYLDNIASTDLWTALQVIVASVVKTDSCWKPWFGTAHTIHLIILQAHTSKS
ncbi:hypothetical protein CALCODRAFT_534340 [Calocera cornea HHB12733]|uniref:ARM repeat-containing protein n=1 Tax=Calocera cornea HHB12733 TaxID=1353952 RepID=A0A165I4S6_9BASI|nr:hypothetical protein CALCODRAFT_534340 [Calocera cornea HHB12733]